MPEARRTARRSCTPGAAPRPSGPPRQQHAAPGPLEDLTVEIARRGLGDESPSSVLHFEAKGSLVGSTLTLFPGYSFLDRSQLPSPIVSRAQ
jgi:hypothetical protein